MNNGYIKLYRALMDKPIWLCSTPEQKVILVTLLMMANHDEKEWEWQGEKYHCKPGEFITSLQSIADECGTGVSMQNVRTALKRFKKYEFLTCASTSKNTKITIENWGKYQGQQDKANKLSNKRLTNDQQTTNKRLTTNKNDKNDKNDKKNNNKGVIIPDSLPADLKEPLEAFIEMRRSIKAPLTDRALEMLLKKLNVLSGGSAEKSIEILNQSTMNCWKGIFPTQKEKRDRQENQFLRMIQEGRYKDEEG